MKIKMNTETKTHKITVINLTIRPPRSSRVLLGGYAILPRLLDKARADIAGVIGEYHTNCTIDKEFLTFVDVDYEILRSQLEEGKGDGEILEWIERNARKPRSPWEIQQWSEYQSHRAPSTFTDLEDYFREVLKDLNPLRCDVKSWADLLDLDDYCSFGGIA